MTHAERLARLRLIRTPHVGPVSWHQLMSRFGSGVAALEALRAPTIATHGRRSIAVSPRTITTGGAPSTSRSIGE